MARTKRKYPYKNGHPWRGRFMTKKQFDSWLERQRVLAQDMKECGIGGWSDYILALTYKKYLNEVTSDKHPGRISPPAWFRRQLNRARRRHNNNLLATSIMRDTEESMVLEPDKPTAVYLWF